MLKQDIHEKEKWICSSIPFFEEHKDVFTKWIHYCAEDETINSVTPIFENTCYVLALFRLHQLDLIKEAEERLTNILGFQQPNGLFPAYIHQYPSSARFSINFALLIPLLLLHRYYFPLFNPVLKERFAKGVDDLIKALNQIEQIHLAHTHLTTLAIANYLVHNTPIDSKIFELPQIGSSHELVSYFLAFQFLLETSHEESLHRFYREISNYLDVDEKIYIGPLIREKYHNARPGPTLLDVIFFNKEAKSSVLFYTPLINANALCPLKKDHLNHFVYQDYEWSYQTVHKCRLHFLKKYQFIQNQPYPGLHLIRVLAQDGINLALFPGGFSSTATVAQNRLELAVTLNGPHSEDEEMTFFLTKDEKVKLFVNEKKASVFSLHDQLSILIGDQKLLFKFQIEEGSGLFFGALSFGSRPCEENKNPFLGTDWIISVRFTKRTEILKFKIMIELLQEERGSL